MQERLTNQIANALKEGLGTEDVAIIIDAVHLSVSSRGISDTNSSTITSNYSGKFKDEKVKAEFISLTTPRVPVMKISHLREG